MLLYIYIYIYIYIIYSTEPMGVFVVLFSVEVLCGPSLYVSDTKSEHCQHLYRLVHYSHGLAKHSILSVQFCYDDNQDILNHT